MDPVAELGPELPLRTSVAVSAPLSESAAPVCCVAEAPTVQPPPLLHSPVKFCLPGAEGMPLTPHLPPHVQQLHLQQQLYTYALQQMQSLRQPMPALVGAPWGVPYPYKLLDPRFAALCRPPEEPKPQHSYIGLIAMAILSHADKKLVLSDIYQYILDNYSYFRNRGTGWRNSIRHNLSLNDCFIKAGRSPNGKGHYWAIHPANIEDFKKGDFRRRKAQRRVRKHMGLSVDDEDSMSPPPPPTPAWAGLPAAAPAKRRQFDVASLLAPDVPEQMAPDSAPPPTSSPQPDSALALTRLEPVTKVEPAEDELDVVNGGEESPSPTSELRERSPIRDLSPPPASEHHREFQHQHGEGMRLGRAEAAAHRLFVPQARHALHSFVAFRGDTGSP